MSELPSGRQFRLSAHDQELVVVEVGGGIRVYRAGGRDVLDGYPPGAMCDGGRGQILAPWPNRLEDGAFGWEGGILQSALDEVDLHNAIHGLVRWSPWWVVDSAEDSLRMGHRLHPRPGWPWTLDFEVAYRLGAGGLSVAASVVNSSPEPCPFGLGWHPYVAAFGGVVDDLVLTVPAATVLRSDGRGLPAGRDPVAATGDDFSAGRRIGASRVDTAFTGLARGPDGRAVVSVTAPGGATAVRIWMDRSFGWVMVYTGDTLPDPGRRRRGLAVEPMTAPPNMLRSGEDRVVLEPGGRFRAEWGIEPFS